MRAGEGASPHRTQLSSCRPQYMALPGQQDPNLAPGIPQPSVSQPSDTGPPAHRPSTSGLGKPGKKPRERWTSEEHDRFLEGLKMYHRDWRSIEKHVGTKTAVQIRSHAQKFFAKAEREPGTVDFELPPPRPKRKPASATNNGSTAGKSAVSQGQALSRPQSHGALPMPPGPVPSTWLSQMDAHMSLPPGSAAELEGSADLMRKIAAAAIAAASTTAHAVISAAGPEYLQVIQDLAKHDRRLSFLSCPITDLVSSLGTQGPADVPAAQENLHVMGALSGYAAQTPSVNPAVCAPSSMQPVFPSTTHLPLPCSTPTPATTANPAGSGSGFPGVSSFPDAPPVQLLNQLLTAPSSSQLLSDQIGAPDASRPGAYGSLPSSTGLTDSMLVPRPSSLAGAPPEPLAHAPMTAFNAAAAPVPAFHLPGTGAPPGLNGPWLNAVLPDKAQDPELANAHDQSHPASGQVQSTQHAVPAAAHEGAPPSRQGVQAQQQHQQHVFPKHEEQPADVPGPTNGYGEQGSGGGSGAHSGGGEIEMPGSGDKSGSKSAKQSGNRKAEGQQDALPQDGQGGEPAEGLPNASLRNMPILHAQGRLSSAQRAEFYKQYYHEMIRRGAEGLRSMNVRLGSSDLSWLGPDATPVAEGQTPATQAQNAKQPKPAGENVKRPRELGAQDVLAWSGRKKQRTADTPDMHKAALSDAREQPAAIYGMLPCPPDANIFPLEPGRFFELHKGTGWAIEVEQQDTATSAQGASRDGCTIHPDARAQQGQQTSGQKQQPEVSKAMDTSPKGRNMPNSSGEGSNEPAAINDNDDGSGDGPQPEPEGTNPGAAELPEQQVKETKAQFQHEAGDPPATEVPRSCGSNIFQESQPLPPQSRR